MFSIRFFIMVLVLSMCGILPTSANAQEVRSFSMTLEGRVTKYHPYYYDQDQPWMRSGLYVYPGDILNITATGEVSIHCSNPGSPDCTYRGPDGTDALCGSACVRPELGRYGVIATVGWDEEDAFFVGSDVEIVAAHEGYVWFALNDSYYLDNDGSFQISGTATTPSPIDTYSFHLNPVGEWHSYDVCVVAGDFLTFEGGDYLVQIGDATPFLVTLDGLSVTATTSGCISLLAEEAIDVVLHVAEGIDGCYLPEREVHLQTIIETETVIQYVEVEVFVEVPVEVIVEKIVEVEVPYEVIVEVEVEVEVEVPAEYTVEGALAFLRNHPDVVKAAWQSWKREDHHNRSGHGDGTNPGRGKGRKHTKNQGTDNPHQGRH